VVLTSHIAAAEAAVAPAEKENHGSRRGQRERIKVFQLYNGFAPAMANVLTGVLQREACGSPWMSGRTRS
jgi:hypothetical protein